MASSSRHDEKRSVSHFVALAQLGFLDIETSDFGHVLVALIHVQNVVFFIKLMSQGDIADRITCMRWRLIPLFPTFVTLTCDLR